MADDRVHSETRKRSAMVNFRVLPEEHEQLKQTASREGITVGELLRKALLDTRAITA